MTQMLQNLFWSGTSPGEGNGNYHKNVEITFLNNKCGKSMFIKIIKKTL